MYKTPSMRGFSCLEWNRLQLIALISVGQLHRLASVVRDIRSERISIQIYWDRVSRADI